MSTSKEFFLSVLNVLVPNELIKFDLTIQRENESEPFCTIITDKNGRTFLRVNPWDESGVRILI